MIDERQNLSILIDVQWQDDLATYKDSNFILKTNFWRDFYPAVFDYQIKRAELNQTLNINYAAGDLIENNYSSSLIQTISIKQFNQYYSGPIPIQPAAGRFYPRGMIEGVADCFKMDNRPFRILSKTDDSLEIDLNHPLARFPIQVSATITDIFDANQQNGGRCNEIAETITANGPGFQVPLASTPFDFSQPIKVFQQIARILKPGGVLLIGSSDRFFEKKAIGLWDDLHTFERMGIVLEYFRQAGEFEDLHAQSIRGLIRHNNDPFINKNVFSCPMFMLSGKR